MMPHNRDDHEEPRTPQKKGEPPTQDSGEGDEAQSAKRKRTFRGNDGDRRTFRGNDGDR